MGWLIGTSYLVGYTRKREPVFGELAGIYRTVPGFVFF